MLGTQDLLVILAIAIVVFGAKRIPEIGKSIGEGIKNYKKSLSEPDAIDITPKKDKEGAATGREGEKGEHSLPEKKE
jgi:sec-independent protein translocase protein TatA